jgi:hypothetical protein
MNKVIALCVALLATAALAVTCPPCDQAVCNTAVCGSTAPYYCESGTSAGGCGPSPASWNNTKMCTACCDTSACSSTRFSCGSCSVAECESQRRCSLQLPYMCTNGTSAYGCATTPGFWPLQQTCGSCCDVSSCVKQCAPCTAAQCAINTCTSTVPYFCAAGPLKNGCSASATYFADAAECYACCDSSACPTPAPPTPTSTQQ